MLTSRYAPGDLAAWCAAQSRSLRAQAPLTLEAALREAHTANAVLPVAAFDARIAVARVREARGALGPRVSLDGDLHGGAPARYAGSDGRLQILTDQPLYEGGALRAGIDIARAEAGAGRARFRQAEKDLDLNVRIAFAELVQLDTVIAVRREGLARLGSYLAAIEARRAAGEGVGTDVLKTRVQIGVAAADLGDAGRQRDQARLTMNDLLGRDLAAPLILVGPPVPEPPPEPLDSAWAEAPEVRQAVAQQAAARSVVTLVAADRRPHLDLSLNAGTQPAFSAFGSGLNNGQGKGAELLLSFSWPLLDVGVFGARRETARLGLEQAGAAALAVRRQAHLAWAEARAELAARYAEVQTRDRTAATALDSYLSSESLYRGGGTSALDVLDAYDAWIAASEGTALAVLQYRVAAAQLERWGTP